MARLTVALLFVAMTLASCGTGGSAVDPADGDEQIRIFGDLENVENSIFALGQVWAVTSSLPDNFSPGEADASLLRIDPTTGDAETVRAGLAVQPTFASFDDRVWVKLEDRIVAFDQGGVEVASLPWRARGDLIAGERYLWVTDVADGHVSVIDPATAEVVRSIQTGAFPVAPIVAFGHAWIPSSTDGTVTTIDEATLGSTTNVSVPVTSERLMRVTAVPGATTGDEVWVTNIEGELFAIGAETSTLGELRTVSVDRPVNRLVVEGDHIVLLPLWGLSVVVADLATGNLLAEIPIDSIPVRAVAAGDQVWITSDGTFEALTRIDLPSLSVVEQVQVGTNQSTTTGPTQPFVVGDEIWVPNRGDDAIFAVAAS